MNKPSWRQYQEDVATFYRSLGLDARVEEEIEGVRGKHEVDVAVRGRQAGMEFLWVVECKAWKSNIPKEKVMALNSIVDDIGADRGILLSEQGFQAGAIRAANRSQVKLTSLAELRVEASDESTAIALAALKRNVQRLIASLDEVVQMEHHRPSYGTAMSAIASWKTPLNWNSDIYFSTASTLSTIRDSIWRVELGVWPAPCGFAASGEWLPLATSTESFIEIASTRLAEIADLLRDAVIDRQG